MDWKTIAPIIGAIAPMAGSILGGLIPFPGGSMIGQKFGEMIAKQLGVAPTPQAVNDALGTAGEETKRAVINSAVEQARIEVDGFVAYERAILEAQVKNLADVNTTIRFEAEQRALYNEHWFFTAWRPTFGWVFITIYGLFGLMLTVVTGRAVLTTGEPFATLNDAWPLFLAYFGPGGLVLGVMIPSRSYEKGKAMDNSTPMPNAKVTTTTTTAVTKPPVVPPKITPPNIKLPLVGRTD